MFYSLYQDEFNDISCVKIVEAVQGNEKWTGIHIHTLGKHKPPAVA